MDIKSVCVLGAGAVGSYFIWGLSEKLGNNLSVCADGERYQRLSSQGLTINGQHYDVNVSRPDELHGVDLLLIATKYNALEEILPSIKKIVDPEHTIVLSLLNGIDSEDVISDYVRPKHLIHSCMKIQSTRTKSDIIFDPDRTLGLYYGIPGIRKEEDDPALLAIRDFFKSTDIRINFCPDILETLWSKFLLNVSSNLPQAILDVGIGAAEDSIYVKELTDGLANEVAAIAEAKGIHLGEISASPINKRVSDKNAMYSTLQDVKAKRHTEVDVFAGRVIAMGEELGIKTPFNKVVYLLIKAIEEKNDGKFDYNS